MDNEKIELLKSILYDLAKGDKVLDDANCEEVLNKLRHLYSNDYRHLYSQIYATLVSIDKDINLGNLEYIAPNIKIVYEYCINNNDDQDFNLKVKKLYDHVNLDSARISYIQSIQDENNNNILRLKNNIEESNKQLLLLTQRLEKEIRESTNNFSEMTENKIEKLQKDYVAILGIFASVVITFVAGISLSNSTLAALKEAGDNFYTLVFLAILIAMFIFNSLRALFDFLLKITDRKNPFETVPLFTCDFNIIFVVMMVIDYICYICFGKK